MVGRTISRYKITEKLGEGGMGVVYKARDMDLDRSVALKFLPAHLISDSNIRKRFLREAKAAASISHPNICTVYEIGEADGSAFISMAYLDGRELSEEIEEGPIAVDRAVDLATQFADGLAEAHRAGMVHRDIKPANLFVGTNGCGIILDFGIAQLANAQTKLTKEGAVFGTYAYMSPEQALAQKVDARTDVWALGCVLYEMLSGQRPFRAEYQPALVYSIINEKPEPLTEACENVPPGLAAIISSCLSKDPADRPENGAELAARLRSPNELATAASSFGASFKLPSIKRAWLATGAALLSVAAALLFWTSAGGNDAPVSPGAKHVAVIPFQTGQEDLKVFAGGLTEAVTHRLSQYEGRDDALLVTPASETRRQDVTTAADARAKFGATHAVEGALSGEGDRLRLVLSVIDTNSMRASASAIIEANRDEALSLQDETVANIVSALELGVKPEYAAELNTLNPVEPAAYEFYIQGLGYLQRNDRLDDIDNAIGLFEHALSLDPEYARAYADLGTPTFRNSAGRATHSGLTQPRPVPRRHFN